MKTTPSGTPIVEVSKDTLDDMVEQIKELRAEVERLKALIDKHDDERRECPVIGWQIWGR